MGDLLFWTSAVPVRAMVIWTDRLLVTDQETTKAVVLAIDDNGLVTLNGDFVDLGDSYPMALGIFDAVRDAGLFGGEWLEIPAE